MSKDLSDPIRQQIRSARLGDAVGIRKALQVGATFVIRAIAKIPIIISKSFGGVGVHGTSTVTFVPKPLSFTRTRLTKEGSAVPNTASFIAVHSQTTVTDLPIDTTGTFTGTVGVIQV